MDGFSLLIKETDGTVVKKWNADSPLHRPDSILTEEIKEKGYKYRNQSQCILTYRDLADLTRHKGYQGYLQNSWFEKPETLVFWIIVK
jgi:hypothetical protein